MKRLELVEFLKGYSIFSIMVFHFLQYIHLRPPFDKMICFGGTGTHLFVLLSGFGLYYSYLNKPSITLTEFYRKRFLKVYVPALIVAFISAAITCFIPIYKNSWYALGGHVFLYKMFDETIIGSYGYQLWFISMILQFYIVFFAIVRLKEKWTNTYFILVSILVSILWSILVAVLHKELERVWNSFFLQYFWEFAIGMVVAEKVHSKEPLTKREIKPITFLLVGGLSCMVYVVLALKAGTVGRLFNDFFALTGYSFLAIWVYNIGWGLANRFFLFVGKISFSVYLLHFLVLLTISMTLKMAKPGVDVVLALMVIFPVSIYYQRLIDLFFKKMKL